jgi:hypothetical protein
MHLGAEYHQTNSDNAKGVGYFCVMTVDKASRRHVLACPPREALCTASSASRRLPDFLE